MTGPLRNEIMEWRFLDSWSGFLPWKDEKHVSVTVHTDASSIPQTLYLHKKSAATGTRNQELFPLQLKKPKPFSLH